MGSRLQGGARGNSCSSSSALSHRGDALLHAPNPLLHTTHGARYARDTRLQRLQQRLHFSAQSFHARGLRVTLTLFTGGLVLLLMLPLLLLRAAWTQTIRSRRSVAQQIQFLSRLRCRNPRALTEFPHSQRRDVYSPQRSQRIAAPPFGCGFSTCVTLTQTSPQLAPVRLRRSSTGELPCNLLCYSVFPVKSGPNETPRPRQRRDHLLERYAETLQTRRPNVGSFRMETILSRRRI